MPPFAAGAGVQSTPGVASAALVGARASSWAFQFQGSSPYCKGGRMQPTTMAAPTPIAERIIVVRPGRPRRRLAQKGRPSGGLEEATAGRRRRRHRTGRRRRMDGCAGGRASPPQPCAAASPAPAARRPPAQGPPKLQGQQASTRGPPSAPTRGAAEGAAAAAAGGSSAGGGPRRCASNVGNPESGRCGSGATLGRTCKWGRPPGTSVATRTLLIVCAGRSACPPSCTHALGGI